METNHNLLIFAVEAGERERLYAPLLRSGQDVASPTDLTEALWILRSRQVDVFFFAPDQGGESAEPAFSELKSAASTSRTRIVVVTAASSEQRQKWLDLGADAVLAGPWDEGELHATLRAQLRVKRQLDELDSKVKLADEGREVAQTAFQALAVTEKMTRDAFSLGRLLKVGVSTLLGLALVVVVIFFVFFRRAEKENRKAYSLIAEMEKSVQSEQQLLASARKLREDPGNTDILEQKEALLKQTENLKQKISSPGGGDVGELRRQLTDTTSRLAKIEGDSQAAEGVIRTYARSVCLLHVSVVFNVKANGRRLRYGGMTADGPLKDSDGNIVYTTEGRGPEVKSDFFGTGFVAGDGKILTNHHVVQPWWQNEQLAGAAQQGLEPVIGEMEAFFPGAPSGVSVGISQISPDADLALLHGDLTDLNRPILKLDASPAAAVSGEALISLGYATGLDAILARAGDEAVQQILQASGGEPRLILQELAKRQLIRPLVTQGHVGDVLPDKIVYDAQTTSGGSGGPLLNRQGGVIGVTFAIVRGFGGSNFGVPIRFASPLLKH